MSLKPTEKSTELFQNLTLFMTTDTWQKSTNIAANNNRWLRLRQIQITLILGLALLASIFIWFKR